MRTTFETTHVKSVVQFLPDTMKYVLCNILLRLSDSLHKFHSEERHIDLSFHIATQKKSQSVKLVKRAGNVNITLLLSLACPIYLAGRFPVRYVRTVKIVFTHVLTTLLDNRVMSIFEGHSSFKYFSLTMKSFIFKYCTPSGIQICFHVKS